MTYSPTFGNTAAQADPFAYTEVLALKVEFIMDSYRVSGELRYSGPPRRVGRYASIALIPGTS